MILPIIVIGAGGHAKVVIDALLKSKARIIGAADVNPARLGADILGVPVVGGDEAIFKRDPKMLLLANGLGAASNTSARAAIFTRFQNKGYQFVTVIHPSALIASDVVIGEGSQIMAGAVVQPSVKIGANCIINTRASIDHDCLVGDHAHIAPGATISGGVTLGDGCHVGSGAVIIQGLSIGASSVIGAGAAVIRDVAEGTTVVGVPAKKIIT